MKFRSPQLVGQQPQFLTISSCLADVTSTGMSDSRTTSHLTVILLALVLYPLGSISITSNRSYGDDSTLSFFCDCYDHVICAIDIGLGYVFLFASEVEECVKYELKVGKKKRSLVPPPTQSKM